jgi:hypothetical protein
MGLDCSDSTSSVHFSPPPLTIEKVERWCEEADAGLCETFGHDYDALRKGVEAGSLELWRLWGGEAWAITRVEAGTLTCCCYQGRDARAWMHWLMTQGRRMGLTAIVFYTKRRGLARMFKEYGFLEQETVYRAPVQ